MLPSTNKSSLFPGMSVTFTELGEVVDGIPQIYHIDIIVLLDDINTTLHPGHKWRLLYIASEDINDVISRTCLFFRRL